MVEVFKDTVTSLHFAPGIKRQLGERKTIYTDGGCYTAVVLPLPLHPAAYPTLQKAGTIRP